MYDIETKEDEWNFFNLSKSEIELQIMVTKQSIKNDKEKYNNRNNVCFFSRIFTGTV